MANNATLKKVFKEVQAILESDKCRWISEENTPEDYFDWGLSYNTTADSIIHAMVEDGDLLYNDKVITQEQFEHILDLIKQHALYQGDVFETANLIERSSNDSSMNQALSTGLYEGWIEETA